MAQDSSHSACAQEKTAAAHAAEISDAPAICNCRFCRARAQVTLPCQFLGDKKAIDEGHL